MTRNIKENGVALCLFRMGDWEIHSIYALYMGTVHVYPGAYSAVRAVKCIDYEMD